MKIGYANEKDLDKIKDIWNYCFRDEESFVKYYFDCKYKPYNTIVVEDDNEIQSSLQLNQYKIKLNNKIYDTSYVVGVSTLPSARSKGYMKDLMQFTLNELYNKNQLVSILMPIDYRLYRKYGYEHCYDQLEYNIDIEGLKDFNINGEFHKAKKEHIDYLIEIYNYNLANYNGYIYRDKFYYENLFKEIESEDGYIYIHKNENYEGYIIYFIIEDTFFVREMCYKNINSLKSMLKFIFNHNTQCKKYKLMTPINDNIKLILPNLKNNDINLKPFMMGRIINVEKFLNGIYVNHEDTEKVYIKIEDNQIKENNFTFELQILNNKVVCSKCNKKPNIKLTINNLTQLAFGYIDINEILFLENIKTIENNKNIVYLLNAIFEKKQNYINEYV